MKTFFLFLLMPILAFAAEQDIKSRMLSDVDFLRNTFEVYYAPKEWKQNHFGWDLDTEINKAKNKIQATPNITTKQYQMIVKEFFQSPQDYHVDVLFYSTEAAILPFDVKGVNGRYFISYIDDDMLPSYIPLKIGDELISFDGMPVKDAVQELMRKETRHANEETDHSFATHYLTQRGAELGHEVPEGVVKIEVKGKIAQMKKKYALEWAYVPELISDAPQAKSLAARQTNTAIHKSMGSSLYGAFKRLKKGASESLGGRKSFVPQLGQKILWKSNANNPFYAYLFEASKGKKIGYVRIPDFDYGKEEFEQYAKIIALFQKNSDALVIDQVDNPGGKVSILYDILSVLTDKPLDLVVDRMMLTQEDVEDALYMSAILSMAQEDSDILDLLQDKLNIAAEVIPNYLNYYEFVITEWNSGRNFTNPCYIYGIDVVNPSTNHISYTKPILVLINEKDISGGDLFPAIMQDNKRATLFGTRTAGAGGVVLHTHFPNRFGIKEISYTASLSERADKNPIENLGVAPDIEYKLTEDDLQNNYRGYVKAVNAAVMSLLD